MSLGGMGQGQLVYSRALSIGGETRNRQASGMGYWLLILAVLGGFGLFLAMPGALQNLRLLGYAMLLAGAAVTAVVLGTYYLPDALAADAAADELPRKIWFVAFALIGLWGATRVITHTKPVYAALYFILVIIASTGLLFLAQAEFLAAALLTIYAGAILVTYVFVIMLAQAPGGPTVYDRRSREPFLGCLTGFVLLGLIAARLAAAPAESPAVTDMSEEALGTLERVGLPLLSNYMIGIQITGVLLLAAMVGAIAIARRRALPDEEVEV